MAVFHPPLGKVDRDQVWRQAALVNMMISRTSMEGSRAEVPWELRVAPRLAAQVARAKYPLTSGKPPKAFWRD